jgi:hypothetical protein
MFLNDNMGHGSGWSCSVPVPSGMIKKHISERTEDALQRISKAAA